MEKELRFVRSDITIEFSERIVSGYAIRFMEESVDLGGFIERIHPEAISIDQIRNSDIFALFNHDDGMVLGRTGAGTLKLDLREDGLYYEINVPNTVAGNELLEHIKRGEMYGTSFAFSLPSDGSGEVWSKGEDGNIYRDITNIEFIWEISPVFEPAYPTTTVSARSLEKIQELNDMIKEKIELRKEEVKEPEKEMQEEKKAENCNDKKEERVEDDPKEEMQDDKEDMKEDKMPEDKEDMKDDKEDKMSEDKEEKECGEKDKEERNTKTQNKKSITMEKRFSLLKAIREVANNQQLDAASQAVVNAGAEEMRKAGQSFGGQIQIPTELRENPVHYTVEADGSHVVVTDYLNILEPLKAKNVLVNAGANYLTGLVGNVQIPSMSAENVFWEGEVTDAKNGAGAFEHINMAPRRLSAYIDISKQFLAQDSLGAEALIRKQLVEAINDKLEATILSDAAVNGNVPAGIFNGVVPTEISDYASVCNFESELDQNNFVGEFKYVINPKAKAYLRASIKGTNATGMILENDAIDGTPAEVTTHMKDDTIAYGDWNNLYIGQWGGIDLTVDNYTQATKGCVRLVINAFFDYKVVRDGAIVLGKIKRGA